MWVRSSLRLTNPPPLPVASATQQQIAAHGAPIAAQLFADGFEDGFTAWSSLEGGRNESITVGYKQTRESNNMLVKTLGRGTNLHSIQSSAYTLADCQRRARACREAERAFPCQTIGLRPPWEPGRDHA